MPKHMRHGIGQRDADHEKNGQAEVHLIIMDSAVRTVLRQINRLPAYEREARAHGRAARARRLSGQTNPAPPVRPKMVHGAKSASTQKRSPGAGPGLSRAD